MLGGPPLGEELGPEEHSESFLHGLGFHVGLILHDPLLLSIEPLQFLGLFLKRWLVELQLELPLLLLLLEDAVQVAAPLLVPQEDGEPNGNLEVSDHEPLGTSVNVIGVGLFLVEHDVLLIRKIFDESVRELSEFRVRVKALGLEDHFQHLERAWSGQRDRSEGRLRLQVQVLGHVGIPDDYLARQAAEDSERRPGHTYKLPRDWVRREPCSPLLHRVVNDLVKIVPLICQVLLGSLPILANVQRLNRVVALADQVIVAQFCDDVLLLHHLYLLQHDLEVDQRKIVQVLEEDPELGHRCSVDDLHELGHLHVLIALEALVGHVALVGELLEDIRGVLVGLVAPEEHGRLLPQG